MLINNMKMAYESITWCKKKKLDFLIEKINNNTKMRRNCNVRTIPQPKQ